ncbi:hypothetical protein ABIA32_006624 [Streptacidiphilus sp. MAP12-20]|uniref:YncE family protein n=1 Tax=Streptacidiphilus sp. MAP12-20 TaxID=3156299 RepID=UPI0035155724
MQLKRFSLASTAAVVAGLVTALGPTATAAQADPTDVTLPVGAISQLVVDGAHGHIFFAAGAEGILVTDLAGKTVATMTSEQDADGMALSADGRKLYVGLGTAHAIAAIDTGTLTESARYPVAGGLAPSSVAVSGGKLWFSYAGAHPSDPTGIGSVDIGAATPTAVVNPVQQHWYTAPLLAASPAAPGRLVIGDQSGSSGGGDDSARVGVYDVSSGAPVASAKPIFVATLNDMAITPDGRQLVLASAEPTTGMTVLNHRVFRLADLAEVGAYPGSLDSAPDSVAISPNGTVAAGSFTSNSDVAGVYAAGDTAPVNLYFFARDMHLGNRGLAWGPGGSELFAVTRDRFATQSVLHIFKDDPQQAKTSARLQAPVGVVPGTAFTIRGALDTSHTFSGSPVVKVTRTSAADHRPVQLPDVRASWDLGRFAFTDTVPTNGLYSYQISYAGDAVHTAASATTTVDVRVVTALGIATNARSYAYGATATITAHLGTTRDSRRVSIYAQPNGGAKVLVRTGTVDAHGNLAGFYRVTGSTTLSAVFAGDSGYRPSTASSSVGGYAGMQEALRGYYTSAWSGSTLYRVYHHAAGPQFTVTVSPGKASQCVVFDVQRYWSGAWHDLGRSACTKLDTASTTVLQLTPGLPVGALYRIDATYVRSSTDTANLSTTGAWQYFAIRA